MDYFYIFIIGGFCGYWICAINFITKINEFEYALKRLGASLEGKEV